MRIVALVSLSGYFRVAVVALAFPVATHAQQSNCIVNMSHYDYMRPDFARMKSEGIIGVIHEATYPRFDRDARYAERQFSAARAGLLWGAYHYGDATDPVRQADHFLRVVENAWRQSGASASAPGVLLVLDFEQNTHYPGGTMRPEQAAAFVERIHERTGRYPGVYGSEYRLQSVLHGPRVSSTTQRTLSNCWLWIANYHFQPRSTHPWDHWTLWQYTGDGKCDLRPRTMYPKSVANVTRAERNIFRGSATGAASFWQQHGWQPNAAVKE